MSPVIDWSNRKRLPDEDVVLRSGIEVASELDSQRAADARKYGMRPDDDPEVLEEAKRRAEMRRMWATPDPLGRTNFQKVQASPTLFRFFADPSRSAHAHDSMPKLVEMHQALTNTGKVTSEGRPVFATPEGVTESERSLTVTDPRVHEGRPTNIPSLKDGLILTQEGAIREALKSELRDPITGREFGKFDSIGEAELAAALRSRALNIIDRSGFVSKQMYELGQGFDTIRRGYYGMRAAASGDAPQHLERLTEFDRQMRAKEPVFGSDFANYVGYASNQTALRIAQLGAGVVGGMLGAGVGAVGALALGQLGPQAAVTVPAGAFAGSKGGAIATTYLSMAMMEGGNFYADLKTDPIVDEQGNALLTQDMEAGAALMVGAVNGAIEMAELRLLLGFVPGIRGILLAPTAASARAAMREALMNKSFRQHMGNLGKTYLKNLVGEPAEEYAQATVSAWARNALEVQAGKLPRELSSIAATPEQAFQRRQETIAALKGISLMGAGGVVASGTAAYAVGVGQTQSEMARLRALHFAAADAKFAQIDPEGYQRLVDELAEEAGTPLVFVTSEELAKLEGLADVKWSPETAQVIEEAINGGDAAAIPMGEFMVALDTSQREKLLEHATLNEQTMTPVESREFLKALESFSVSEQEGGEEREVVLERYMAQIREAKPDATPEEVGQMATVMQAFVRAAAVATGDPDVLKNFRVEGPKPAQEADAGTETLGQPLSVPPSIPPRFRKLTAAFLRGDQSIDEFLFTAMPKAIMFRGDISVAENMEEMHQSIAARLGLNPDLDLDGILPVIRDVDSDEVIERGYLDRDSGEFIPAAEFDAVANTLGNLAAQKTQTLGQPQDQSAPSTGDATDQAVSAFNRGVRKLFAPGKNKAHHGSPFDFDKFDLTKVGTGEGEQAFGWGLYFATRKGIAEFYRKTLSVHSGSGPEGLASRTLLAVDGSREAAVAELRTRLAVSERADPGDMVARDFQQKAREAIRMIEAGEVTPGQLFEVELPGDENLIDWDKPMSEQDPGVIARLRAMQTPQKTVASLIATASQEELATFILTIDRNANVETNENTGDPLTRDDLVEIVEQLEEQEPGQLDIYLNQGLAASKTQAGHGFYAQLSARLGSDRAASEALAAVGILGHKYLDNASRDEGEGTNNYVIYDDNAIQVVKKFYQTLGDENRGEIEFDDQLRQVVIRLFDSADLSTFLHEAGHGFFLVYSQMIREGKATDRIKTDMGTLLDWFAIDPTLPLEERLALVAVEHHEKLANGMLQYFREGKAPSPELISAFQTFRSWLTAIWQSVKGTMIDVGLDDATRGVFDRMLATPEQIEAMQNLTPDEIREIGKAQAVLDAKRFAEMTQEQTRIAGARNEQTKARNKKIRAEKTRLTPEVEAELAKQPVWRLRRWLEAGELIFEDDLRRLSGMRHMKLDRQVLLERLGPELVALLPRGMVQAVGADPDLLADLFGFDTLDDMVQELIISKPGFKAAVKAEVNGRLAATLQEAIPEAQVDGQSVQDALLNLMSTYERILSKRAGEAPTAVATMRAAAKAIIGAKKIKDLRPGGYQVTMTRQAMLSIGASADGKAQEALIAKRRQMFAHLLKEEARKRKDRATKDRKAILKVLDPKSIKRLTLAGGTYREQALALAERFEFKRSAEKFQRTQSLAEWVREQEAEFEGSVAIPAYLWSEIKGAEVKSHWRDLTADQLSDLRKSFQNIAHLARIEREVIVRGEKMAREALIDGMVVEAKTALPRNVAVNEMLGTGSQGTQRASKRRAFEAGFTQVQFVIDTLGHNDPKSFWRTAIWDRYTDARDAYNDMWERIGKPVVQTVKDFKAAEAKDYHAILNEKRLIDPETGRPFLLNKWNLLMISLNVGNESNLDKLLRGYDWDRQVLFDVLDTHMTEVDWRFVRLVAGIINSMWPQIEALERKINGTVPKKVPVRDVVTKFGTFHGWYFPVRYDKTRTPELASKVDVFSKNLGGGRAHTNDSVTKTRTNVAYPILFDTSVITYHLHDVILRLTHEEFLRDARKILSNPRVISAINQTLGPEYGWNSFFLPWLQDLVGSASDPLPIQTANNIVRTLRLNASVYTLGGRLTTMAMQAGGLMNGHAAMREALRAQGVEDVKVTPILTWGVLKAMRGYQLSVTTGDETLAEQVLRQSSFMRNRTRSFNREAREVFKATELGDSFSFVTNKTEMEESFVEFGMSLIGLTQLYTVDIPLWLASRQMGVDRLGLTEPQARRLADSIVEKSQGTGEIGGLSSMIRSGNEFLKAMLMFYTYQNTVFQGVRFRHRQTTFKGKPLFGQGSKAEALGQFIAAYTLYVVGPEVFAQSMRMMIRAGENQAIGTTPPPPLKDEDAQMRRDIAILLDTLASGIVGGVPIARDFYQLGIALLDPSQRYRSEPAGAALMTLKNLFMVGGDVSSSELDRSVVGLIQAVAVVRGWPLGYVLQLARKAAREN